MRLRKICGKLELDFKLVGEFQNKSEIVELARGFGAEFQNKSGIVELERGFVAEFQKECGIVELTRGFGAEFQTRRAGKLVLGINTIKNDF